MAGKVFSQEACAEAGEEAGEDSAEDEKGQIGQYARYGSDGIGCQKLADVVAESAHGAGEEKHVFLQQLHGQSHHQQGQQSPGKAVEQGQSLPEEKGGQEDSGKQYQQGIFGGKMPQQNQGDDIGKAKLQAGNGHKGRNRALNGVDCKG